MRSGNYPQCGDQSTPWPAGYPRAPDQGDRERQDPVRGANRSRRIVGREDVAPVTSGCVGRRNTVSPTAIKATAR
jgi:hypothetical protein